MYIQVFTYKYIFVEFGKTFSVRKNVDEMFKKTWYIENN